MSHNNDGRPMEQHTKDILDIVRNECIEKFLVDRNKFMIPENDVIDTLFLKNKRLNGYSLNLETVKLALKRYKSQIMEWLEEDFGVQVSEKASGKFSGSKMNESTRALLNLVISRFPVLLESKFPCNHPIYATIFNRDELAKYKDDLSPALVRVFIGNHMEKMRKEGLYIKILIINT